MEVNFENMQNWSEVSVSTPTSLFSTRTPLCSHLNASRASKKEKPGGVQRQRKQKKRNSNQATSCSCSLAVFGGAPGGTGWLYVDEDQTVAPNEVSGVKAVGVWCEEEEEEGEGVSIGRLAREGMRPMRRDAGEVEEAEDVRLG